MFTPNNSQNPQNQQNPQTDLTKSPNSDQNSDQNQPQKVNQNGNQNGNSSNFLKNNNGKQFFYYLVLVGCIFALAIASFTFLRANLVRFVFPDVDNYSYPGRFPENDFRCKYKNGGVYPPVPYKDSSSASTPSLANDPNLNSPEEIKECEKKIKEEQIMETNRQYQQAMLNSILTIVISSLILVGNVKFLKQSEI